MGERVMMVSWSGLMEALAHCQKCPLAGQRHCVVPGEGNPNARLMLIGEGPGAEEDRSGRRFVGRAGPVVGAWRCAVGMRRVASCVAVP